MSWSWYSARFHYEIAYGAQSPPQDLTWLWIADRSSVSSTKTLERGLAWKCFSNPKRNCWYWVASLDSKRLEQWGPGNERKECGYRACDHHSWTLTRYIDCELNRLGKTKRTIKRRDQLSVFYCDQQKLQKLQNRGWASADGRFALQLPGRKKSKVLVHHHLLICSPTSLFVGPSTTCAP